MDKNFRHIEDGFLTSEECKGFINMAEGIGFEEALIQTRNGQVLDKSVRNNDRVILDDPRLASQLWSLIKPLIPETVDEYTAVGLNEKFRFYRYQDGQEFKVHLDGAFKRNEFEHSKITAIIYLNDGYELGQTVFVNPYEVVDPKEGRLLLFAHKQMHKGNIVPSGVKYVLRTDVMYRREPVEGDIVPEKKDEMFLGVRSELGDLKKLSEEWALKGYVLATGKISENKVHEIWAIRADETSN